MSHGRLHFYQRSQKGVGDFTVSVFLGLYSLYTVGTLMRLQTYGLHGGVGFQLPLEALLEPTDAPHSPLNLVIDK